MTPCSLALRMAALLLLAAPALAQPLTPPDEPAKSLPTPGTVSPAMQAIIFAEITGFFDHHLGK